MSAHAPAHRLLHVCVMFIHQRLYLKSSGSVKLAYCKNQSVEKYKALFPLICVSRSAYIAEECCHVNPDL